MHIQNVLIIFHTKQKISLNYKLNTQQKETLNILTHLVPILQETVIIQLGKVTNHCQAY